MKIKNKIVIYPYDIQSTPLLRYRHLLNDYEIIGVVSPKGWGLNNKDASSADGGPNIGIIVNDKLENLFDKCDTVIFIESENKLDFNKVIYPKILKSIDAGKNIICNLELENDILSKIKLRCRENNVSFKYNFPHLNSNNSKITSEEIYEINVPVIFVLGITERTNKFNIQLALRDKFLNEGYKVSQIGTKNYCEIFGFHSFPRFMFDPNITENEKIISFNYLIKDIEQAEKPDVIIVGIPGGTFPINKMFTHKFGILALEVSLGIKPDAAVFSVLYEDYYPEYFEQISNSIRYKFGFEVTCFNQSNTQLDWLTSKDQRRLVYNMLDSFFIDKKISNFSNLDKNILNVLNPNSSELIGSLILDNLADNSSIESI
ncbi:peptide maturation system protein, TIGR04066 family [Clostridium cavendishii DSM 21758]|uniref:Peptide maturation system protein, TIGR04066 family n=1 Tax=Clostridium cavendishii DSM 21758 TaxID=1121302 RepID=A0A1M6IUK6_9CLOT|nr:TIGR04066 family peptide maturation system protein [Clostridium cavendishii]SHJ38143.1 peptide maturation system protein, TIGR04066 family [Clostridium cavendishii DSM 21758]